MARVVRALTALPATHAFIRERYEPCLCLSSIIALSELIIIAVITADLLREFS